MKKIDEAYIGLDLHASTSVFGVIDKLGNKKKQQRVSTDPVEPGKWIGNLPARNKYLAIEEGPLTQWVGWQLAGTVDELVTCDPKQNFLISRSARKKDGIDAFKLARLLRMGELATVWHPEDKNNRALFAGAAHHYLAMRRHQVRLKQQIKALYRRWGVLRVEGESVYGKQARKEYLRQVSEPLIGQQLLSHYAMMDGALAAQDAAKNSLYRLGKAYGEIPEMKQIPGIGAIGAHLASAIIQTPHRFATAWKLWSYSQLGVTDRSSSGKPLGFERLDRSGRAELKDISYRGWKAGALQAKDDNEVKRFYEASLQRTHNATHARLNTQRKLLKVIWTIWIKDVCYDPQRF
jgi:hypothetical protein